MRFKSEWEKLGRSLQDNFQKNQERFWTRVKGQNGSSTDSSRICDHNGQVIEDKEGVLAKWKI